MFNQSIAITILFTELKRYEHEILLFIRIMIGCIFTLYVHWLHLFLSCALLTVYEAEVEVFFVVPVRLA